MSATVEEFILFADKDDDDFTERQKQRIQVLLDMAAQQITSFLGTSNWATDADTIRGLDSDGGKTARYRQMHIVKRYMDNSEGVVSESFDGFSVSMDNRAFEGIRLTEYDKEILSQNRRKSSGIQFRGIHKNFGSIW
jgi:hypothetical protein